MKKICFLLNAVSISGGVYVVFQHAGYMQDQGFDVTVAVKNEFTSKTFGWHPDAKFLKIIPLTEAYEKNYDLVVATFWNTIYELPKFNTNRFAYFVQSIESRFYEATDQRHSLALQTYKLPIYFVSIADWMGAYLQNIGASNIWVVKNGMRKDLYSSSLVENDYANRSKGVRILVEGPFGVPYKNTALAIKVAKNLGIKDIWVLTSTPVRSIPWVSKVFSQVPIEDTPDIYRSCDVLLKLSTVEGLFGPPLEMFHCGGTAVVMEVSGHDEYIIDNKNAIVIRRDFFEQDIEKLKLQIQDQRYLDKLKDGATHTAALWPSWDKASSQMIESINQILASPENKSLFLNAIARIPNDQEMLGVRNAFWYLVSKLKRVLPSGLINSMRTIKIYLEVLSVSMRPK
jgi:O-antigen biosynthesis protein